MLKTTYSFDEEMAGSACVPRASALSKILHIATSAIQKVRQPTLGAPTSPVNLEFVLPLVRQIVPYTIDLKWVPSQPFEGDSTCVAGCFLFGTRKWLGCVLLLRHPYDLRSNKVDTEMHAPARQEAFGCLLHVNTTISRMLHGRNLLFAGFGCGGAIAQILALQYATCHYELYGTRPVREVYTFGSPKTGTTKFCREFSGSGIRHLRVVVEGDGRPHLPLLNKGEKEEDGGQKELVHTGELCFVPLSTIKSWPSKAPWLTAGTQGNVAYLLDMHKVVPTIGRAMYQTWHTFTSFISRGGRSARPQFPYSTSLKEYVERLNS